MGNGDDGITLRAMYGYLLVFIEVAFLIRYYYNIWPYGDSKKGLYRIISMTAQPPDWANMSVSYRALLYRNQPITSISETGAIQGSVINHMLYGTTIASMVIAVSQLSAEIAYNDYEM